MELKIHKSILSVKKAWLSLENSNQSPYQSFFIAKLLHSNFPYYFAQRKVLISYYEILEEGKPLIIAPLMRQLGVKDVYSSMVFMIGFNVYDFIYDSSMTVEKMKECVLFLLEKIHCKELEIHDLPESSVLYKALKELDSDYAVSVSTTDNVNIPLGTDYDEYYHHLSKHSRQNIRTAYNRLNTDEKSYEVQFTRGKELNSRELDGIIRVYSERRDTRYSIKSSAFRYLYTRYLNFSTLYQQKWDDNIYAILYIDNEIAAFMSGIIWNGERAIILRVAINEAFNKYSPGIVLINETAKQFINSFKIENLDLSKGVEKYKLSMGGVVYPAYTVKLLKVENTPLE